jgi:hypothetical protein
VAVAAAVLQVGLRVKEDAVVVVLVAPLRLGSLLAQPPPQETLVDLEEEWSVGKRETLEFGGMGAREEAGRDVGGKRLGGAGARACSPYFIASPSATRVRCWRRRTNGKVK